jgi:hypothetical protein
VFGKLLFAPNCVSSRIVFSYSPGGKFDGLGAQLQRVLGVNALGDYWKIRVQHDSISEIAIHPLDKIQSDHEYSMFLQNVNYVVGTTLNEKSGSNSLFFNELRTRDIIYLFLLSWWKEENIFVQITHPYFFVDAHPDIYECESNRLFAIRLSEFRTKNLNLGITLHHRHGVGNMAIQPGQRTPREISVKTYLPVLTTCLNLKLYSHLFIFTDAPDTDIEFVPPASQRNLWAGLPAFDGDRMVIAANAFDVLTAIQEINIVIFRGGNPLESLANMTSSQVLILSRSSFGYIAALLNNQAEVWLPSDFWHPPLKKWKRYTVR